MRILNLSLGQDTGGQQWRLARAWRQLRPDDHYLSMTTRHTFYPIENRLNWPLLRKEWELADVVHLNNDLRYIENPHMKGLPKRPLVIHHHGTMFRTRPDYHLQSLREYDAVGIAPTVDLHAIAPDEVSWLPQAYDPEELAAYRREYKPEPGILKVAHAPTNRPIKSTDALANAVRKLQRLGVGIKLDIIERVQNSVCLKRKAQADVFVDQLLLGYGCNAIEAYGMGIPVIAGVDVERTPKLIHQEIPANTREVMQEKWGRFPFMEATEQTLHSALLKMADPKVRAYWSGRGKAHFNRHHAIHAVVPVLEQKYREAINRTLSTTYVS